MMFRYAIGNAERLNDLSTPYYGWLDALAEQTHQPYHANGTAGPTIRVNSKLLFSRQMQFLCETLALSRSVEM